MLRQPRFSAAIIVFLLLALAGCADKRAASASAPAEVAAAPALGGVPASDRSLVVTMDVSLTVEDVDAATARIRAAVEAAGGFIAEAQTGGSEGERTARLELRVPASRARGVRSSLGELGVVNSASEKVEDVTEQRADLEARLRNARVQEKRLLEILAGKTSSIADLVEAEKELSRVRENVERLEAQERVMKGKIELATIRVSLATRTVAAWQTPGTSLKAAASAGLRCAAALSVYGAIAFVMVAPIVLPVAAVVLAVFVLVRRRRRTILASHAS